MGKLRRSIQRDVNLGNGERCFRLTPYTTSAAQEKASAFHCDALRRNRVMGRGFCQR